MIDLTKFEGHTPGAWHECDHHGRRWIETIRDDAVAQIVRTGVRSAAVANSALIAAAPDLLAEVIRLRRREQVCATMDEAAKMALIRCLQECLAALGMPPDSASPADLVVEVIRLRAELARLNGGAA